MRYRIVMQIEVDDKVKRVAVNSLAMLMMEEAVTPWSNPVFVATEVVSDGTETQVLRK